MSIRVECIYMCFHDNPFVVDNLGGHKAKVVVLHVLMQALADCRELRLKGKVNAWVRLWLILGQCWRGDQYYSKYDI